VGACAGLGPDDQVTSNHRGHGHLIAKGGDARRVMAELFGREDGYAHGRGGTQHMACIEKGFLGSNGVTGGGIPIATGAALAARLEANGRVVLCFFGDGAAEQGVFHESLNIASLWKLPVVYYCENNLYAMSTPVTRHSASETIAERASAYAMPGYRIDGNDYFTVRDTVHEAAERARSGEGPTLVEAVTYRHRGHSRSDQREYRTREEEADALARDGIARMREALIGLGATAAEIECADRRARATIEDAVEFATQSPAPTGNPEEWVYAE
jgi:acetoin:2,6-dichlorophenolindophenol oxidoreductase subunit alpha